MEVAFLFLDKWRIDPQGRTWDPQRMSPPPQKECTKPPSCPHSTPRSGRGVCGRKSVKSQWFGDGRGRAAAGASLLWLLLGHGEGASSYSERSWEEWIRVWWTGSVLELRKEWRTPVSRTSRRIRVDLEAHLGSPSRFIHLSLEGTRREPILHFHVAWGKKADLLALERVDLAM